MKLKKIFLILSICCFVATPLKAYAEEVGDITVEEEVEMTAEEELELMLQENPEMANEINEALSELQENEVNVEEPVVDEFVEEVEDTTEIEQFDIEAESDNGFKWVSFIGTAGQNSSLPADAQIEIKLSSADVFYEVTLTVDATNNYRTQAQLPEGTYRIVFAANTKDEHSGLFVDYEGNKLEILEDGQQVNFEIISSKQMDVNDEPEVVEEIEEKKESFWWTLFKNNIVFMILLLGCAIALFVIRWRKDNM